MTMEDYKSNPKFKQEDCPRRLFELRFALYQYNHIVKSSDWGCPLPGF